jgi:hypothetical protein
VRVPPSWQGLSKESYLRCFEVTVCEEQSKTNLDEDLKRVIFRSHSGFTTTIRILDIVYSCLLKNECESQWSTREEAAERSLNLKSY